MAKNAKKKKGFDFEGTVGTESTSTVLSNESKLVNSGQGPMVPVLQITTGTHKGKIYTLDMIKRVDIGRGKDCELSVQDPSVSRRHVEIFVTSDGACFIKDLKSTNGTNVNGDKVEDVTQLETGDRIQLGEETIIRFSIVPHEEAKAQLDIYNRATTDPLTGAYNRRHFFENLDRELALQRRAKELGVGVILFDVDHFKKVNDTFGHIAGDQVLVEISNRVRDCIRTEDIFSRYGGEEFALLIRNENKDGLIKLAERLRAAMESSPVNFDGQEIQFRISLGITFVQGATAHDSEQILQIADEALYDAKKKGRNQWVVKLPVENS